MKLEIARIYDQPAAAGYRVLVDRLWPRGVSKQKAQLDLWAKEIAPSANLRTWFNHRPDRLSEFTERYRHELDNNAALAAFIDKIVSRPCVILLYGARDPQVNHALVLRDYLLRRLADHGTTTKN